MEAQQRRQKERQKQLEKQLKEKEEISKKLATCGLWNTTREVKNGLSSFANAKDKKEALKVQIKFRRKVL